MIVSNAVVWILTVTLSSAPDAPKSYEFQTQAECNEVQPLVTNLYLALGEQEVNTKCEPLELPHSILQPLNVNMIYSL